jgi:hypothetical protein
MAFVLENSLYLDRQSRHACNTGLIDEVISHSHFALLSSVHRTEPLSISYYSLSSSTIISPTSFSTTDCSSFTLRSEDVDRLLGTGRGRVLCGVDRDEEPIVDEDLRKDFLFSSSHLIHCV